MNALAIIGMFIVFCGLICCVVAGAVYEPPIQRYLEKFGKTPAFFLFSWSGLQDYFSAKQVAKEWGHNPPFLRRYARMVCASAHTITTQSGPRREFRPQPASAHPTL